jgi:hypothetical protein
MTSTFAEMQQRYRGLTSEFFGASEQRMRKLHDLLVLPAGLLFFYVKRHSAESVKQTKTGLVRFLPEEYAAALGCFKKRFFDLDSRPGKGSDLVWKGVVNPPCILEAYGMELAVPLPKLVALHWFVSRGLDELFWADYEAVNDAFKDFSLQMKQRYTDNHRVKKNARRAKAVSLVLARRGSALAPLPKQPADLSHRERRMVVRLMTTNNKKNKKPSQTHTRRPTAALQESRIRAPLAAQAGSTPVRLEAT